KHLLDKIPPADLRSADFNTVHPVGAGPFAWQAVAVKGDSDPRHAQQQIALKAFADYQGGQPKLQKFIVHVYADEAELTKAFESNQLTAAEGLNSIPPELVNNDGVQQHNLPLRAANMVFFKTTSGVLADQAVRQALVRSANVPSIVAKLGYPARLVREPILLGQVAYDKSLAQPGFDLNAAKTLLDNAGWTASKEGVRSKAGQPLAFVLTAPDTQEARFVAKQLQAQWRGLGAKVTVLFLRTSDFQNALTYHSYDAILNGISIGDDPDVFVYWDSSQADIRSANRLNLSEYKNPTADSSLEAGRTRSEPKLRVIKYKPFLEEWQKDAPALGLYQPRVIYLTNGFVNGLSDQPINTATDRFDNVQNWQIREAKVTN
ncbi:MAG TPA: ABC transporter substrate-binding protein, partial [Methylomirabilota bacterium]|nr:ABC transporter substrate-binding protein [Methylomirabilota bacterium]